MPAGVPPSALALRPWVERSFHFTLALDLLPVVLERLRGAPARLEEKLRTAPAEQRTRRPGDAWSIQEHAGHLIDLDDLHYGRLDDFAAGLDLLRAADMQNRRTHAAGHNARDAEELAGSFRRERLRFVDRIESLEPADLVRTALHPRLKVPMRVIDMAEFVAEHDDHHLARMTEIARSFGIAGRGPAA